MANVGGDKYRSYLTPEELKTTKWQAGPPNYDAVNKLFEDGRTNIWPAGSLEERIQNFVKTWEMELVHKADPNQYKTLDPQNFVIGINGKRYFTLQDIVKVGGSYNLFLQTSLPPSLRFYDPDQETYDSSQTAFKTVFPRGFALEILQVYSGPPVVCYKFRHWGYMEGPFKGYEPTGELVEFFGTAVFEVWPAGSLEEQIQNFVKTWEMEMVHKADPNEYKTLDPQNFVIGINGKRYFTLQDIVKVGGSYNLFLQTSLPPSLRFYDPDQETYDSSQTAFKTVFPRGFALEILQVYSGPPVVCYKFRHWGYMEGPFKGYEPTGELIEVFGIGIFELDENSKVVKIEFFSERGELLAALMKGKKSDESASQAPSASGGCPFMA